MWAQNNKATKHAAALRVAATGEEAELTWLGDGELAAGAVADAAGVTVGAELIPGDADGAAEGEGKNLPLGMQFLTEGGAVTWQAVGRVTALVRFRETPSPALFLNSSHRQSGFAFSTVFSPEQQDIAGFGTVLPSVTKERQSARFMMTLLQSAAGAGAR